MGMAPQHPAESICTLLRRNGDNTISFANSVHRFVSMFKVWITANFIDDFRPGINLTDYSIYGHLVPGERVRATDRPTTGMAGTEDLGWGESFVMLLSCLAWRGTG